MHKEVGDPIVAQNAKSLSTQMQSMSFYYEYSGEYLHDFGIFREYNLKRIFKC